MNYNLSDVNECDINNGGCKICTNSIVSFSCSCITGYFLDEDNLNFLSILLIFVLPIGRLCNPRLTSCCDEGFANYSCLSASHSCYCDKFCHTVGDCCDNIFDVGCFPGE